MDRPIKKTNLLILRGVSLKDFLSIESIFDKKTSECLKSEPVIVYTELPKKFLGMDTWPTFSNLKCWECDQLPISYPKFTPLNPEKDRIGNYICDIHGHFCEWNCVVSYVIKTFPKDQQWDILQYICLFESIFSGLKKEKIMPAPPKTLMKSYCGRDGITPKQWRDKLAQLNNDYSLTHYKLEHYRDIE
jgi:hypothetical protein